MKFCHSFILKMVLAQIFLIFERGYIGQTDMKVTQHIWFLHATKALSERALPKTVEISNNFSPGFG